MYTFLRVGLVPFHIIHECKNQINNLITEEGEGEGEGEPHQGADEEDDDDEDEEDEEERLTAEGKEATKQFQEFINAECAKYPNKQALLLETWSPPTPGNNKIGKEIGKERGKES
jgi:hypothetical protein